MVRDREGRRQCCPGLFLVHMRVSRDVQVTLPSLMLFYTGPRTYRDGRGHGGKPLTQFCLPKGLHALGQEASENTRDYRQQCSVELVFCKYGELDKKKIVIAIGTVRCYYTEDASTNLRTIL